MKEFNTISPETTEELFNAVNITENFRFGAGCTDLIFYIRKMPASDDEFTVINLKKLKDDEYCSIKVQEPFIRIGALVTAAEIVRDKTIKNFFPALNRAASLLASRQIRNVATIGGNICTASPAGDITTALVALEAVCEIASSTNIIREIPLSEFLVGVRKTALAPKEVLRAIKLKLNKTQNNCYSDFIKIGTRKSMECSIISLAYHFILNENGEIEKAGIAIGSVSPKIMFTSSACDFLVGKSLKQLKDDDRSSFANHILNYASPISDVRASDWYRKQVLFNISKGILETD
ncbi:MAG: FAD binding domain-containing protein [Candidatus Kapabacteria bacterium]|nr:FAD binding domain-containing protein [Candidatus Kapabacteria bacterium]